MALFERRPRLVRAAQWFPPGHPRHRNLKGVSRHGSWTDKAGRYYATWKEARMVSADLEDGDYVAFDENGDVVGVWSQEEFESLYMRVEDVQSE